MVKYVRGDKRSDEEAGRAGAWESRGRRHSLNRRSGGAALRRRQVSKDLKELFLEYPREKHSRQREQPARRPWCWEGEGREEA